MVSDAAFSQDERIQFFFEPCKSKEELRRWIKLFLHVELPDEAVDKESTSTPLDFVWTVYSSMMDRKGPKRHVAACARNTGKTLTACVIRFLGMVHFRRSGTHLAADLNQAASASMYLEKFLLIPELTAYVKSNNARTKELHNLPANSFTDVSYCNVRIVTATIKGVNSQRGSLNTRDEVDLVPQEILSESAFIADPTPEGLPPVEVNLSSRKSNSGPIQRMIDEAEAGDTSIVLHKWSMVDWMKPCPAEEYRPDLGRITAWINNETLATTWGLESYNCLSDAEKQLQRQVDAFHGCRACTAFIACQARSQARTSTRGRLRDAQFVAQVLKEVADSSAIIAQALNWKPESSAVVFRVFNRRRHFLKAAEFYRWVTGQWFIPPESTAADVESIMSAGDDLAKLLLTPIKRQIYEAMRKCGWKVHFGIDWGSHDPAVCVVVGYHKPSRRMAVLHVEAMTGYPNEDWAKYVAASAWINYPGDLVCPDMEDPNGPIYFGRLHIPCHDKKPPKIAPGVSQIRSFLWNPITQKEHFAMLDDGDMGMNRWCAECMEKWTYKKTVIGYDYAHFEDNQYTHPIDALRYAADPWIEDASVSIRSFQPKSEAQSEVAAALGDKEEQEKRKQIATLQSQLTEHFSMEHGVDVPFGKPKQPKGTGSPAEQQRGWTPLTIDPNRFVAPEVDPMAAEELPTVPKGRIRFRF
jgi:hypothetical protein